MYYPLLFILSMFLSLALTYFLKNFGIKHGLVSIPRKRDVHKKPIPRIGGVAIFLSFIIILAVFLAFHKDIGFGSERILGIDCKLLSIFIGGSVVAVAMLFDDIYNLPAWQKLALQIIAVLIVISSGIGIDSLTNPFGGSINLNSVYIPIFTHEGITYHFSLWSDLLTMIWIVGMMNTINFIDGVDGLAGGVSFISLITIFLLSISAAVMQPTTALIAIILAGSVLGFLFWNFPPAKIFMGDSGSMFIGFIVGVLSLISGGKLATVFLVLGFPIVDGLFVVLGRLQRHENPFTTPDKTHLHHRFLKAGYSPRQSIIFIYLISIVFAVVALQATAIAKLVAAVILIIVLLILIKLLAMKEAKQNS